MSQLNEPDNIAATKVVAATEGDPMCVCANCGALNPESKLGDIKNYSMRVDAGEVIPAGECPEDDCCGALCHYVDESLHEIEEEDDEEDEEPTDGKPRRFVAYWGNGEDARDGDDQQSREFTTFEAARDFVLEQLAEIRTRHEGTDTGRLAEYIYDDYLDVTMDFETGKVGGYVYSVSEEDSPVPSAENMGDPDAQR